MGKENISKTPERTDEEFYKQARRSAEGSLRDDLMIIKSFKDEAKKKEVLEHLKKMIEEELEK